jgi:hypothetical protein
VVEEPRVVTVTLLPSDEYRLYEPSSASQTVVDNEPTITFTGITPGNEAKPNADAPADATTPIKLGFTMDRPPTRAVTLGQIKGVGRALSRPSGLCNFARRAFRRDRVDDAGC